jgi:hypothetical protein
MARVADYSIIADGWVLERDKDSINFDMPSNVDSGSRCVLGFMFDAGTLDDTTVTVKLNGTQVWSWTASGSYDGPIRFFQEVIPAGVLKSGSNTFKFHSSSDDFTFLQLSDIVVWWQANV